MYSSDNDTGNNDHDANNDDQDYDDYDDYDDDHAVRVGL